MAARPSPCPLPTYHATEYGGLVTALRRLPKLNATAHGTEQMDGVADAPPGIAA